MPDRPGCRSVTAVSKGRKFGERRHRVLPSACVAVRDAGPFARCLHSLLGGLALPPRLAFLAHEAMVAGLARWAVCDRSAPRIVQDLCATTWQPQPLSRQRMVPRLLERRSSPGSLPARESLSLMVGFAWAYSMLFVLTKTWVFDLTVSPYLLRCGHRLWSSSSRHRLWPVASSQNASAVT